jgi:hypothetical protein
MKEQKERNEFISRRSILKGSAIFLFGGAAGRFSNAYSASAAAPTAGTPSPLPWKWVKLDPMEAGRRAYRAYFEKKG